MRVVSEQEFQQEAFPTLRQLFLTDDPYGPSFGPASEERLVLFPYKLCLEPPLLEIIVKTAKSLQEDGFYVSILRPPPLEERLQPYHWFVSFEDLEEYQTLVGPLENVIYSPKGTWGLMGSYEWHGLLGGRRSFINTVKSQLPNIEKGVIDFLVEWKGFQEKHGADVEWVSNLVFQAYDTAKGLHLLKSVGIAL